MVYTSPLKALSNQKYRELYEEFRDVSTPCMHGLNACMDPMHAWAVQITPDYVRRGAPQTLGMCKSHPMMGIMVHHRRSRFQGVHIVSAVVLGHKSIMCPRSPFIRRAASILSIQRMIFFAHVHIAWGAALGGFSCSYRWTKPCLSNCLHAQCHVK